MKHDTINEPLQAPIDIRLRLQESIYHDSQVVDDWFDTTIDSAVHPDTVHTARINHFTDQILEAVDESYQVLSQFGDPPGIEGITKAGVDICLQRAIEAKANDRPDDVTNNLQKTLLLEGLGGGGFEYDSYTILHVVENGLATDLLRAAKPLKDIHIRCQVLGKDVEPATGLITAFRSLLNLAANTDNAVALPEDDEHPEPLTIERRRELYADLEPDECIALSKHQANNLGNLDAAAHTALLAIDKIESSGFPPHSTIAVPDLIADVHAVVNAADANSSSTERQDQFDGAMAKLLSHRAPNLHPYRTNDFLCGHLDYAVVRLVAKGHADIAAKLISGADGEEKQIQGIFNNIAEQYGEDYQQIRTQIEAIYQQKRARLQADLADRHVRPDLALDIAKNVPYPEAALGYSAEQWEQVQRLPNIKVESILSNSALYSNDVISALKLIDPSLSEDAFDYVFDKAYVKVNGNMDAAILKIEQLNKLVLCIDEINQNRPLGTDIIRYDYAIKRLQQRYTDPLQALEALRNRYPQASYMDFIEYCVAPFELREELLTPQQQQRYDAIHGKFEGICERPNIIHITFFEDIEALENLDPENLRAALSRVYSGPNGLSERIQITKERGALLRIQSAVAIALRNANFSSPEDYNSYLTEFRNVPDDVFEAWLTYAKHDDLYGDLIRQLFNVDKLPSEDHLQRLHNLRDTLNGGVMDFLQTPGAMEDDKKIQLARTLLQSSDGHRLAPLLKTGQDLLGAFLTTDSLRLLGNIMHTDTVPEELLNLGVTKPGEAGINQLKSFLGKFTQSIFQTGEIPAGLLVKHSFLANYVKAMVRYETSQFGNHGNEEFLALVTTSERGNYQVGAEYYIGQASVAAKDQEALTKFTISEDAIDEYNTYARIVRTAQEIVPATGPVEWAKFGEIFTAIQQDITSRGLVMYGGLEKLQAKIDQFTATGKDTGKLQTQVEQLQGTFDTLSDIDFQNVEDFDITALCQTIQTLSSHNSIAKQGNLQTLLVATALLKNRYDEHVPPEIDFHNESPDLQQIGEMADLIGHLTNQEVWGPLFSQVGGEKQLQNLLSLDALTATIERSKSIATKGQQTISFLPTRGALMELSGHIADACWASKHESLAELHPNTTAVIFIQNPDTSARRMAGATLLIETTSAEGEPLLVIRGLNPLQNIITGLDSKSFVDEFTAYAREIAEDQGRKLAIVIDDHCSGSSTNRPTLFAYLSELKASLKQIPLASEIDTTINGYNIVNDTYLI